MPGYSQCAWLDSASLVLALVLQIVLVLVINQIPLGHIGEIFGQVLAAALIQLIKAVVQLYTWALIIIVIISWVAPGSYHPGAQLLAQITEPLLAPIRRVLPPMGGLDLSPMVLMLLLLSSVGHSVAAMAEPKPSAPWLHWEGADLIFEHTRPTWRPAIGIRRHPWRRAQNTHPGPCRWQGQQNLAAIYLGHLPSDTQTGKPWFRREQPTQTHPH